MHAKSLIFLLILCLCSCNSSSESNSGNQHSDNNRHSNFVLDMTVTELRKGDILVKPNANFLPGTSLVENGFGFGHAVLVSRGYEHNNIDSLLAGIYIVESMAANVSREFQVREVRGIVEHNNPAFANVSFQNKYKGNRYRLRLNISPSQIDSIVAFAREQKGSRSSWSAMKKYPENYTGIESGKENRADNHDWYCSLLVWQAVLYVTGIDLDVNTGYQVYPNDLINHPIFNNTEKYQGRVRF